MGRFVKSFGEMTKENVQEAGGKAANLSELTRGGFNVPPGFCVTSEALPYHLAENGLDGQIEMLAATLDYDDFEGLENTTSQMRALIATAPIPSDLEAEIREAIAGLVTDPGIMVAVRSSVAVKGTAISSFPGMMDTFHYLRGEDEILDHVKRCWASLWTTRAAVARRHKDIDHSLGLISPVVQKMVHSEVAGVLFTANPITGSRDELVVESNWGLGESVVSGKSMNDFYVMRKSDLAVSTRRVAKKTVMCDLDRMKGFGRVDCDVPPELMEKATLSDAQLRQLGETGKGIEDHFGHPQDIEWAYEGGRLYILQSRNIKGLQG